MTAHHSRRRFLSGLARGAAATVVAIGAVGCVTNEAEADWQVGPDGVAEVLQRAPGAWYANAIPARIPAVRASAPVAPDWSTSKRAA